MRLSVALSADKNAFEYEPSYFLHGLKQLWVTSARDGYSRPPEISSSTM